jgi:hypothetical protein
MGKKKAGRKRSKRQAAIRARSQPVERPHVEVVPIEWWEIPTIFLSELDPGVPCPICEIMGVEVHHDGTIVRKDESRTAKNPGAQTPGSLFDQPPDTSRSDLPWKV